MSTGKPIIFVENFYSRAQFPGHVVSATEEPVGYEAFRIANTRRSPFDYSTTSSTNIDQVYTSVCDRVRTASMLGLERGHSHAGKLLTLDVSQDNFTTWERVLNDIALPSYTAGSGSIDDALGVRIEEGAWLIRFPARSGTYWRTIVRAEGAGTKQKVVGLQLGMGWESEFFTRPWGEDATQLQGSLMESDAGWQARTTATRRRSGQATLKLIDFTSYDQARYHLQGHFASDRPAWLIMDGNQADRAVLARTDGNVAFQYPTDWGFRACTFGWVEHEPLRAL